MYFFFAFLQRGDRILFRSLHTVIYTKAGLEEWSNRTTWCKTEDRGAEWRNNSAPHQGRVIFLLSHEDSCTSIWINGDMKLRQCPLSQCALYCDLRKIHWVPSKCSKADISKINVSVSFCCITNHFQTQLLKLVCVLIHESTDQRDQGFLNFFSLWPLLGTRIF